MEDGRKYNEEKKCLQEIKKVGKGISPNFVLSNGSMAGEFAIQYVLRVLSRSQKNLKTEE